MQTRFGPLRAITKSIVCMRINGFFVVVLVLLSGFTASAQLMNLSPYSRFGLGDIYQSSNPASLGMGGIRATHNDPSILNAENPATLGTLMNTTFQTSLRFNAVQLSDGERSNTLTNGFLEQFQMAFKRPGGKTGFMLGMSPFSTTGYVINAQGEIPEVGQVNYTYEGNGGITRGYIGMGRRLNVTRYHLFYDKDGLAFDSVRVTKHSINLGVTGNYYFGNVSQRRLVDIANTTFLDTRATDNYRLNDLGADFGLHYEALLKARFGRDRKLTERMVVQVGAIYSPAMNANTTVESFTEAVIVQNLNAFPIDTGFTMVGNGTSFIPARLRGGVAFHYYRKNGRHWMIAADYEQRDWSQFNTTIGDETTNAGLVSSSELAVGMQYTPKSVEEASNVLQRSHYRVGVRNTATYLTVNNNQVMDRALSMGITMPMISSRSASRFHLGMEIGRRGMNDGAMIQEDYMNLFVGFSLSPFFKNAWFISRKYD